MQQLLDWIKNNVSNISSILNIIEKMVKWGLFFFPVIIGMIHKLAVEYNLKKNLEINIDNQTRKAIKYYISTRAQTEDPCSKEKYVSSASSFKFIPYFINIEFKNLETQYYLILADSGMGKTTFALKLYSNYYRKILRKYSIYLFSLSYKNCIDKIKEVKNKYKAILILDAFDEDQSAMENYIERLNLILDETESFYKIIITCRTQFFPDEYSEPRYTGKIKFGVGNKSIEFKKFYLSPFNEKEIHLYLYKKYNRFLEKDKIKCSKEMINKCPEIMVRPMLLAYIDDLIEDKNKEFNYVFEIYNSLVYKWIEREPVQDDFNLHKNLFSFSLKVAEFMYLNNTMHVDRNEIDKLCKEYNIQIKQIEAKSRSLLNRNAAGYYKFAHKSIFEFLLARKAISDFQFRKKIFLKSFFGYDMLEFFLNELDRENFKKLLYRKRNKLNFVNSAAFHFLQLSYLKATGIKLEKCSFKKCDLSKIDWSDSTFVDLSFCDSKMKEISLYRSKFVKVIFENVNMSEANLMGVKLEKTKLIKSNLRKSNLRGSDLEGNDLEGVDLEGARLVQTNMRGVNLTEANLSWANLNEAKLEGAKLLRANLEGAKLLRANLTGADLTGAKLEGADLRGANLKGARLEGAKLKGADLRGSELE